MTYDEDETGYVYRWTNKINGHMYIGSHNGKKKNYIGSGLTFLKAVKKYGIENFDREILYLGPDFRKMEEILLREVDAANSQDYYNHKNEAIGGALRGEKNGMFGRRLTEEERFKCGSAFRGKKRPEHAISMTGKNNPRFGKSEHTHGIKKRAQDLRGKSWEEFYGIEKAKRMRAEQSERLSGIPHKLLQVTCPHCNLIGKGPNMTRYHFDKCKISPRADNLERQPDISP